MTRHRYRQVHPLVCVPRGCVPVLDPRRTDPVVGDPLCNRTDPEFRVLSYRASPCVGLRAAARFGLPVQVNIF